jgi:hypothetical protein
VERWFGELTSKKLRHGVHRSVQTLERDIRTWLADWNEHPRPFVWTKTADEILDKVAAHCHRISECVVANRILFERQRVVVWTEVRVRSRA